MLNLKSIISLGVLITLIIALNTKFGSVPPLGKFFDPDGGFWANAELRVPESEELELTGLKDEVTVYYDERRVPHIFAGNSYDLYYTQGFVEARDRLFQMEMQTFDAAGRLSEIVGESQLSRDLNTRRTGMPYGAEKAIEEIKKDPAVWEALQAYSDGVNEWINNLNPKYYPLEYKILNISPEGWEPIKTAHLLKNMTRTLAGGSNDARTSNTLAYFGEEFLEKYFNGYPEMMDPIIPPVREWVFEADIPGSPDTLYTSVSAAEIEPFVRPEGVGSNNWAVNGDKTTSGFPILANDPHLSLTLPSIWYEIQLHAPGINTYGVTLQGTPGVIIGFNEDAAWGTTNVGSDVRDWYEVKFRDEGQAEYWHDGQWKSTTLRVEEIKVRGGDPVLDTVVYTHQGPVFEISESDEEGPAVYQALRWIAHEPSNDLKTFFGFNTMKNLDDFEEAVSHYTAPAQNFIFADRAGDIALWVSGKLPKKWKYQGRTVSDGTDPVYDWNGWIPYDQNPHIINPERGFVSSANQKSAAQNYPYYLDDVFAPYERGRRINDRLTEMEGITVQDMQNLQMDNYSYHAATILPVMLNETDRELLSAKEREILTILDEWEYFNNADELAPGIFREWWSQLYAAIFYDEYETISKSLRYPGRDIVVELLRSGELEFIDNIETEETETLGDLATASFSSAIEELVSEYGDDHTVWFWGKLIDNDINHLAYIPGMGRQDVYSGGSAESVNATRGENGPSWRMVVELGPEVKGYGVYPGGASGNPGSPDYDVMVEPWSKGKLYELNFYRRPPLDYLYKLQIRGE